MNKAEVVFEKYATNYEKLLRLVKKIQQHPGTFIALPAAVGLVGTGFIAGKLAKDNAEEHVPAVKKVSDNIKSKLTIK